MQHVRRRSQAQSYSSRAEASPPKGGVLKGGVGIHFLAPLGTSWATLGAVLVHVVAIWSHLSQTGPKKEPLKLPRGPPMSSRGLKRTQKSTKKLPREAQESPRESLQSHKRDQESHKRVPREPKCGTRLAKRAPKESKERPKRAQREMN